MHNKTRLKSIAFIQMFFFIMSMITWMPSKGNVVHAAEATSLPQVTNVKFVSPGIVVWDFVYSESGFEVQLYKDDAPQGTAVKKEPGMIDHKFLSDMRLLGAGVYTVKVTAKGDGINHSDGPQSEASESQTITKLETVTGLTWTGDVAHWTSVANAVSYDVQLYKNGIALNGLVNVLSDDAARGVDFTSAIAAAGNGTYTYKVTAKADSNSLFLDSNQSSASNNNIKAIQLAQVTGVTLSASGVATWNNVPNASSYEVQLSKGGVPQGTAVTKPADTLSHNFLSDMKAAGVGVYTVKVTAKGNGTTYSDGPQSTASGSQTIKKLETVTGLTWTGDVAHWTAVSDVAYYAVQLYNNGIKLYGIVSVLPGDVASGVDYASAIAVSNAGTYTYKVIAKAYSSSLFLDSDESSASNDNIRITHLAQVTNVALSSSGVATWNNVTNEAGYEVQLYKGGVAEGTAVTKAADTLSHDFLSDMREAGAGVYTVKVTAKGNGTTYSDGPQSTASGSQTIIQLATVNAGITWTGNIAHWTKVPNAVSYDVQLYKNGTPLSSPVNVLSGNASSGVNFTSAITGIGGGSGTYTHKVTAKGDGVLILDAAQSVASNDNFVATPLAQVTNVELSDLGVATWDAVPNASGYEVQLSKSGVDGKTVVMKSADTLSHNFLPNMRAAGAGAYTVKVTAKGDGTTYSNGPQSTASGSQTIAKLGAVTGLTWSGDIAHWTTVPNAAYYYVHLYKNESKLCTIESVLSGNAASGVDFTSAIAAAGNGTYTYKVTANADSNSLFLDSDQSSASGGNIKAIQLAQVTNVALSSLGVATWDDVTNEAGYEVQLYKGGVPQGTAVTKSAGTLSHNFLSDMRAAGAGVYTIKVTAKGNGTTYSDGPQSTASGSQTITKIETVTGLTWTGNVAHWKAVSDAACYEVQLYYNGSKLYGISIVLPGDASSGLDNTSAILANGPGTYTYKVTAKAHPSSLFLDSDESAVSNDNIRATQLPLVTNVALSSSGVATWNNVDNESGYEVQLYKDGVPQGTSVNKPADTLSHDFLSDMKESGAGVYTVKVKAKGNGSTYSDGHQSVASGSQTIIKLATVTELTWNGKIAQWKPIANAVSYDAQLYKNGTPLSSPVNVLSANAVNGVDFTSVIGADVAANNGGTYTYKITAKGDGILLLDAAESAASDGNLVATALAQVTNVKLSASGVATWNNVTNETGYEVQLYKDGVAEGTAVTKAADTLSHDFLWDMRVAGAGVYTVKVTAMGDGSTYSDGLQSVASGSQTIIQLAAVNSGLTWTENVAHWTSVADAVSYDVQLYKNGTPLSSPVNVLSANAASGVDFTSAITADVAANKGGTYTYKVTAMGDGNLLLSAAQSAASNDNIKAVSSDATLSGLSISSGTFNESFAAERIAYTASVGNGVSSITVTPTVNESHATVTVEGRAVTSGQSSSVVLNVGANTISVEVTAQDGTTKTYTITVTRAAAPYTPPYTPSVPQSTTETRQVPVVVKNGNQQATAVQTTITRTTDSEGSKKDTVVLDESTAIATVKKALETKTNSVAIVITDIQGNNTDKTEVQLLGASMAQLASNNMNLTLQTEKASLEMPVTTVSELKANDIKVQISEEKDSDKIAENKETILKIASGSQVIASPLNIEANIAGRVKITIPIDSSRLPSSKEELDKFLSSLAVAIHHSDGQNVVDKGTLVYDEKGNVAGIAIWVNKFSSFTLINLPTTYFQGKTTIMKDKVAANKEWQIKFTKPVDSATVVKDNVYVVDSSGNAMESRVTYTSDNILKVAPVNSYKSGETYYLYITKGVKAKDKTSLVNGLRYQFTVK